jgi:hypothetical protein
MHKHRIVNMHALSYFSFGLGALGAAFCWWLPLGMVLSVAGGLLSVIGWILSGRMKGPAHLFIGALVVAIVALALNFYMADMGFELLRFQAFR